MKLISKIALRSCTGSLSKEWSSVVCKYHRNLEAKQFMTICSQQVIFILIFAHSGRLIQ